MVGCGYAEALTAKAISYPEESRHFEPEEGTTFLVSCKEGERLVGDGYEGTAPSRVRIRRILPRVMSVKFSLYNPAPKATLTVLGQAVCAGS